jgi:hypothetical protein
MERTTTLIATIGNRFARPSELVAEASGNVARQAAPEAIESLTDWTQSLRSAWRAATRRSTIYTMMTSDPLAPVVREWARRLDGANAELELAIGLIGDAPMPDFYIVDPQITGSPAHWYLAHLPKLAPRRVIITEPTEPALVSALRQLPYGPALPTTAEVLDSARTYVPMPQIESDAETTLLS